jgi:hypothetical protein
MIESGNFSSAVKSAAIAGVTITGNGEPERSTDLEITVPEESILTIVPGSPVTGIADDPFLWYACFDRCNTKRRIQNEDMPQLIRETHMPVENDEK